MEAKSSTRDRVDRELAEKLAPDRRSAKQKFVLACRMLGAHGHWHGSLGFAVAIDGAGSPLSPLGASLPSETVVPDEAALPR